MTVRCIASLLLLAASPAVAVAAPDAPLTLSDGVRLAISRNPNWRARLLEADMARLDLAAARDRNGLVAIMTPNWRRSIRPTSQSFLTGVSRLEEWTQDYRVALSQKLMTGGDLAVRFAQNVFDTSATKVDFNPSYSPGLALEFSQPLLRDWWTGGRDIERARLGQDAADWRVREQLMKLVADTEVAYWELVAAREAIGVRERSLALVKTLLEINRAKARAGLAAKLDVIQAEASLASREGTLLAAKRDLASREDALRALIAPGLPETGDVAGAWSGELAIADRPTFVARDVTFEGAWQQAQTHRPDMAVAKLDLARQTVATDQAANQRWPKLDFSGSAGLNNTGASGMQAVVDMSNASNYDVRAGVNLEVPLGPNAQGDAYMKSRLALDQTRLETTNTRQQAFVAVRNAVREVTIGAKRVVTTTLAQKLAEAKLDAEQSKLKAGLSTNFQVLTFQEDFQVASLEAVRATIDYMAGLVRLEQAQGTLLAARGLENLLPPQPTP